MLERRGSCLVGVALSLVWVWGLAGVGAASPEDAADDEPSQLPRWSVRVRPTGTIAPATAGVFHRLSSATDVGLDVSVGWVDSDYDREVEETGDDPRVNGRTEGSRSYSIAFHPELRRWTGIWGGSSAAVRSYWGVRLIGAVSTRSNDEQIMDDRYDEWETSSETTGWSFGLGLTLGMRAPIWGPISLSASVSPLTVTRSHDRYEDSYVRTDPSTEETEEGVTVSTSDDTRIQAGLTPSVYLVLSW